ncbi:DUF2577 family protein [Bacillus sp. 3255]|uniref:DUF2577 family protein n=1 Tax=Bacillus sp. 3255 TaxID=2817904 RepID=UPI002862F89A|nr:DUF2577 family protein [Bacillus sp. 3255]MDR6883561.1 hypothetical protein [Bacillus sp. 3255]
MTSIRLEGTGPSRLAQIISQIGRNDFDKLEIATVTSQAPLTIRVNGMKFDLHADDVIVADCVTDREEVIRRQDGTYETITRMNGLKVGDRVIVSSMNGGQLYAILDRMVTL